MKNGISFRPSRTKIELSLEEKLACMRTGMHLKCAESGVSMTELAEMLGYKAAAGEAKAVGAVAGALGTGSAAGNALVTGIKNTGAGTVVTSAMLGIPLGIVSHLADRALAKRRAKEEKLLAEADYYDDATRNLTANLAMSRM